MSPSHPLAAVLNKGTEIGGQTSSCTSTECRGSRLECDITIVDGLKSILD